MSTTASQTFESGRKPMVDMHEMALELKKLLSPEKALFLLYNLVDKNPQLWQDLNCILHPSEQQNGEIDRKEEEEELHEHFTRNVLRNLRALQLSELPLDTLGVITQFLSLKSCLRWSQTASFFHLLIPKYIDVISLEQTICHQIYNLFSKCERLKHLSIDGAYLSSCINLKFPFAKFKSIQELILVNIRFINKINRDMPLSSNNIYRFDGGTYSLSNLQLISCEQIDAASWIPLTSSKHSPDLKNVTIRMYQQNTRRHRERVLDRIGVDTVYSFTKQLVSSHCHSQITNLSLTIHNVEIIECMRANPHFIHNLRKFEVGLMDRRCEEDESANNISIIFQALFAENVANFENLEILLIDFCPNIYSQGYNDISPTDLSNFARNLPSVFPSLQLLALYGSMSQLLFNDTHLHALLSAATNCVLSQIIDLSIGFEGLSSAVMRDHLMRDVAATFPNLAWLTLQNEHFLMDEERFHQICNKDDCVLPLPQWITLCASEKDEIYELPNGVFIEYWERGIEQCDFDAALDRSREIIKKRKSKSIGKF
eukprot:3591_1